MPPTSPRTMSKTSAIQPPPPNSDRLKIAVIAVISIVAIFAVIFFLRNSVGHAIEFKNEAEIPPMTAGIYIADQGTTEAGATLTLPILANIGDIKSVALEFTADFPVENVRGCSILLNPELTQQFYSSISTCDVQADGPKVKVKLAFFCTEQCNNAMTNIVSVGSLNLELNDEVSGEVVITFSPFKFYQFSPSGSDIVEITQLHNPRFFIGDIPRICSSNDVEACNTEVECLSIEGTQTYWWTDETCRDVIEYRPELSTCEDTDSGANLQVKGSVTGLLYGVDDYTYTDTCAASGISNAVNEFICTDGSPIGYQNQYCDEGQRCSDGACVACEGGDEGCLQASRPIPLNKEQCGEVGGFWLAGTGTCVNEDTYRRTEASSGEPLAEAGSEEEPQPIFICTDSDNGNNPLDEQGSVSGLEDGEVYEISDSCVDDPNQIKEWICKIDNKKKSVIMSCSAGQRCSDGACTSSGNNQNLNGQPPANPDPSAEPPAEPEPSAEFKITAEEISQTPEEVGLVYKTRITATQAINTPFTIYTTLLNNAETIVVFESRTIQTMRAGESIIVTTNAPNNVVAKKEVVAYDDFNPAQATITLQQRLDTTYS